MCVTWDREFPFPEPFLSFFYLSWISVALLSLCYIVRCSLRIFRSNSGQERWKKSGAEAVEVCHKSTATDVFLDFSSFLCSWWNESNNRLDNYTQKI